MITMPVTMECAGNGRAHLSPRPVSAPWHNEAVGCAEWTGTPLKPLLEEAGLLDDAVEILFTGHDRGIDQDVEQEAESGDVEQSFDVSGTGDNSNQTVGIQGTANTGNAQNAIGVIDAGDFTRAAECLDLRDVPPKLRASKGAEMARKLSEIKDALRTYETTALAEPKKWTSARSIGPDSFVSGDPVQASHACSCARLEDPGCGDPTRPARR